MSQNCKFVGYAYQENYRYSLVHVFYNRYNEYFWELKAKNYDEASNELREKIIGVWHANSGLYENGCSDHYDNHIIMDHAIIYEVSSRTNIDIYKWYKEKEYKEKSYKDKKEREKVQALSST